MTKINKKNSIYIRSFIFGVEDSLVSTVGMLAGIAVAGVTPKTIFLSGAVLIVVEALSMATGSFLSEESAEEYEAQREVKNRKPIIAAIVMFVSYLFSGLIPLVPYLVFPRDQAFWHSIVYSLSSLFLLGFISARFFNVNMLKKGFQMFVLGSIAVIAGIVVGQLIERLV